MSGVNKKKTVWPSQDDEKRSSKMKKMIFAALAAMLVFALVGCNDVIPEKDLLTDVIYSEDLSSVTVYLNGGVPQTAANRALTRDLARAGYDYFEVVFYHAAGEIDDSNPAVSPATGYVNTYVGVPTVNITRASWEIGEAAGVTNVYRTVGGIDYSLTGDVDIGYPATSLTDFTSRDPEVAYAVLFVGRKVDQTLLAVGKIASTVTDGSTVPDAEISTKTTSVTFEVSALTAALRLPTTGADEADSDDTFLTAALEDVDTGSDPDDLSDDGKKYNNPIETNTKLETATVNNGGTTLYFPAYRLPLDIHTPNGISAIYTVSSVDSVNNDDYFAGVRIGVPTADNVYIKIPPRFPIGGGNYRGLGTPWAADVTAAFGTLTPDAAFPGVIPFEIKTTSTVGVCALTFELPVYAISEDQESGVDDAITWYIRPGFGTGMYDLDNGLNNPTSTGGAILLATGNASLNYIKIVTTWK